MSVWKRLAGMFSGLGPAGKRMTAGVLGQRNEPPIRGTKEFLEVYEASPWVRACAAKTADAVGNTEWYLERRDTGAKVEGHVMLSALANPNPWHTGYDLMRLTQIYMDHVGDAFWIKERNGLGAPVGFYPIPANWIAELPRPDRPEYRVSWRMWQGFIPESEILRFPDPAPADPYGRGTGIIRALGDEIETDEYAAKHAKQTFFNRAIPEVVVMDEGAGDKEIAIHERAWNNKLQGFWRVFKPYFTNRKLDFWQPQAMNLEHLTLVPLRKFERDTILQTWGIPPEQFGITESSNRATADASDYIFESRVVEPRRRRLRAILQARLAPEYDERLVIKYVSTVPRNKEHELNVMSKNPGAYPIDTWREAAGMEPEGGPLGKAYVIPLQSYVTSDPLDQMSRPKTGGGRPPGEKPEGEKPEDEKPEDEKEPPAA